jgi:RHS repeat-associated protein
VTDHLACPDVFFGESPRFIVNTVTGSIVGRTDYDEYGNVTSSYDSLGIPFGYTGGLYDSQTKLVRFGARDYDAVIGRWTAKDPIGFGGKHLNFFTYVNNNPINNFDVKGTIAWGSFFASSIGQTAINAAIGAGFSAMESWAGGSDWMDIGYSALGGGLSGAFKLGSSNFMTMLSGAIAGAGGNLIGQYISNGKDFSKIDPLEVFYCGFAGAGEALLAKGMTSKAGLKLNHANSDMGLIQMVMGIAVGSALADQFIHMKVQSLRMGY